MKKKIFIYLSISFGFTWLFWIPYALYTHGILPQNFDLIAKLGSFGAWGPFIAAIATTLIYDGSTGLKVILQRAIFFKFSVKMWLFVLFVLPLIIGLPLLLTTLNGASYEFPKEVYTPFILPIVFVVVLLTTGPLQEEFGWRGILYEDLSMKINPILAAIFTGVAWALWHIPQFFIVGNGMYYAKPFWGLLLSTILVSIIMAWVYNKTNKSILAMLIMHATFNFSHYVFPILSNDDAGLIYFALMIFVVCLVIWEWKSNLKMIK